MREIEELCKWAFERHPGVTPKQLADKLKQAFNKALGREKNLENTTETGYWKGLGRNQYRAELLSKLGGK